MVQNVKKKNYNLFGYFFLAISFISAYFIRNFDNSLLGLFLFFFVITICVSTDIGGYVFGKIIKGPKLISISPNKTYAGMFGSFLVSLLFVKIYFDYSYLFTNNKIYFSIDYIMITVLISLVSQIGDIVVSFFKRKSKQKYREYYSRAWWCSR